MYRFLGIISISGVIMSGVMSSSAQDKATSNLIFILDKSLSKDNKFIIKTDAGVLTKSWANQDADLYWNIIVEPKQYRISLPTSINDVSITTTSDLPTYFRIAPYDVDGTISGVQITSWTGKAGAAVDKTVEYLQKNGFADDLIPRRLGVYGNTIALFPDAPWALPPPPHLPAPPSPSPSPAPSPLPPK